jgi:hypothetical protein
MNKCQVSLQRALRTLSSIRHRYRVGRHAHPEGRSYRVHIVVDDGDVAWIAATIEALERAIAATPPETKNPPAVHS